MEKSDFSIYAPAAAKKPAISPNANFAKKFVDYDKITKRNLGYYNRLIGEYASYAQIMRAKRRARDAPPLPPQGEESWKNGARTADLTHPRHRTAHREGQRIVILLFATFQRGKTVVS